MKSSPNKILASLALALAMLAALGHSASAQILSYASTGSHLGLGGTSSGGVGGREMGFTMGTSSYSVTSVALPLAFASGLSSTSFTLTLYGYSSAAGSSDSTTPLTTTLFTNPTFTYNNTSTTPTANYISYTFTPTTALTLTAGMTYWLVVSDTDNSGSSLPGVYWRGSTSGNFSNSVATQITATGTGGEYYSTTGALGNFPLTSNSPNNGDFTINGTLAVPEPATWALGIMGALLLMRRLRSQRSAGSVS